MKNITIINRVTTQKSGKYFNDYNDYKIFFDKTENQIQKIIDDIAKYNNYRKKHTIIIRINTTTCKGKIKLIETLNWAKPKKIDKQLEQLNSDIALLIDNFSGKDAEKY